MSISIYYEYGCSSPIFSSSSMDKLLLSSGISLVSLSFSHLTRKGTLSDYSFRLYILSLMASGLLYSPKRLSILYYLICLPTFPLLGGDILILELFSRKTVD